MELHFVVYINSAESSIFSDSFAREAQSTGYVLSSLYSFVIEPANTNTGAGTASLERNRFWTKNMIINSVEFASPN